MVLQRFPTLQMCQSRPSHICGRPAIGFFVSFTVPPDKVPEKGGAETVTILESAAATAASSVKTFGAVDISLEDFSRERHSDSASH